MATNKEVSIDSSYLCTFLRYRLPLVCLDWFRMDSLSKYRQVRKYRQGQAGLVHACLTLALSKSALEPSQSHMVSFSEWKTMNGKVVRSSPPITSLVARRYSVALRTRVLRLVPITKGSAGGCCATE